MSSFTIRVELHGASADQYELLHTMMNLQGFKRTIAGTNTSGAPGVWKLPSGEYDYSSDDESAAQVRDKAKIIGDAIKRGAWVLVTKVAERSWSTEQVRSG